MNDMNLTVEQYKQWRLEGKTDQEILKALHYSETTKRALQKWKKENGIKPGKDKTQFLDREETFKMLAQYGMLETAEMVGVNVQSLYRWEKEQRRK